MIRFEITFSVVRRRGPRLQSTARGVGAMPSPEAPYGAREAVQ